MLQEDSNGEASFEIIDKKLGDSSNNESLSSISSPYSIPSPSGVNLPGGNLLSNVAPPTTLPDFTLWPSSPLLPAPTASAAVFVQPQSAAPAPGVVVVDQFPTTQFSAAIPPSKGVPLGPTVSQNTTESDNPVGGLMGFVKEAFSSGGVLSKMAEKAKNSVDSIITTLDPQMSEYIYSAGDTEVTVTSENEEEVSAIRDAFHAVFGKAWVNGIKLNLQPKISQAIGIDEATLMADERIDYSIKFRKTPTVSIQPFLLQNNEEWYDLSLLLLKDGEVNLRAKTFTQATPVPVAKILKQIEEQRPDYQTLSTSEKLSTYLKTTPGWRQTVSGLSDKEVLTQAAKTLVRIYKNKLTEELKSKC